MQSNDVRDNTGVDTFSFLRKESLDIFNRLHSIGEDVAFVGQVRTAYPSIPLLPNLRCGSWYADPKISANSPAYFKSTDGHFNNWSFNLRRSNLHLLPLIMEGNGLILVDSTRSGKRIPDALSKTIPIWCAVINRALLILHPELTNDEAKSTWDVALYTPPSAVSRQEHSQIEQRLDDWAKSLANSSFCLPILPAPLRPVWITPGTTTYPELPTKKSSHNGFLPVVCLSASKQIEQGVERRSSGFSYVQGSGDDHELWGIGLTPEMFWAHHDELLEAQRHQLPELVSRVVSTQASLSKREASFPTPVTKVDGRLLICTISEVPEPTAQEKSEEGNVAYLILTPSANQEASSTILKSYIYLAPGKRGQTEFLQSILPKSMDFIRENLAQGRRVCVACESGKDYSVGVVLAALQSFFMDEGKLALLKPKSDDIQKDTSINQVDKNSIRTRLEWIIASRPQANPSRTTLKRVNEFLLTPSSFRVASSHRS
ncbi:hypothetical protein CVT25_006055 [Psilocybe cyanescens]|uniref:Initiator tRNA phosphoribosyl transferase n=1 Tax=Psilocybe cyanescens TaxID=93625 RepID=A0A409VMN2_PSICY|nr:hypothetical protein CVT25_006055 [Psilocybe cyanescens]